MLDQKDILSTLDMIDNQHLDIRKIGRASCRERV